MAIQVQCPKCQTGYAVGEQSLGKRVKCRKCGAAIAVETSTRPPAADTSQAKQADSTNGGQPAGKPASASQKIGRYEIRQRLGAGAFGAVYRAYDPVLKRDVALKLPHQGLFENEVDKARFLREPQAAAQLRHPNIVPLYDAGISDGQFYIASAFIEGQTLAERLNSERPNFKPLSFQESAQLVIKLAGALEYAHSQGIVHRDVKPANIMIDAKGEPLLMDFGLARLREAEDKLTYDGTVLGTPAYMAPEQAAGRLDEVGPAADQYSLGVVLYEMLCGERPFTGPPALVISLVINEEPVSPRTHNAAVSRDLETICLKALLKRPNDRYGNCAELASDVRRWSEFTPIRARQLRLTERFTRWCIRNPVVATMTIMIFAVVVIATALVSWQWQHAVQAAQSERNARRSLETQQAELIEARKSAEQREEDARRAEASERDRREQSEKQLYYNLLTAAGREWTNANRGLAEILLEKCAVNRRNWEWHALRRGFERDMQRVSLADGYWHFVGWSSNCSRLICGSSAGGTIVDTNTWKVEHTPGLLKDNTWQSLYSASWNPKGTQAALAFGEDSVHFVDVDKRGEMSSMSVSPLKVRRVAWSPDGDHIAISDGREVQIWSYNQWKRIAIPVNDFLEVNALAWVSHGGRLAIAGDALLLWDLNSQAAESKVVDPIGRKFRAVAWSPAGDRVAVSMASSPSVMLWDTTTMLPIKEIFAHQFEPSTVNSQAIRLSHDAIRGIAWSPGGEWLATCGCDNRVRVWDVSSGRLVDEYRGHRRRGSIQGVTAIAWESQGRRVASIGQDQWLNVWQPQKTPLIKSIQWDHSQSPQPIVAIQWKSDSQQVAAATSNRVRVWKVPSNSGHEIETSSDAEFEVAGTIHSLMWPVEGRLGVLASHGVRGMVSWPMDDIQPLALNGHAKEIAGIWGNEHGTLVASIAQDDTVRLWDVRTGRCDQVATNFNHGFVISWKGAWHPKLHLFAITENSKLTLLGDLSEKVRHDVALDLANSQISSVRWAPNGRRLCVTGYSNVAKILDSRTWKEEMTISGHLGSIRLCAWHPDCVRVATYSNDGTIRVWHVEDDVELIRLDCHVPCSAMEWSPNGRFLAAGTSRGSIEIWDAGEQYRRSNTSGEIESSQE